MQEIYNAAFTKSNANLNYSKNTKLWKLGDEVFMGTTSANTINLKNANYLEIISTSSFENTNFKKIILPDTLKIIQSYTFKYSKANTISFGDNSLLEINNGAFENSNASIIGDVDKNENSGFPNVKLSIIKENAFKNAKNIKHLNLNNEITEFGSYSFEGTTSLKIISLPNNLTKINDNVFSDSTGSNASSTEKLVFSNTKLSSIGTSSFEWCSNLTKVNFGKNLESIDENAFKNTNLDVINWSLNKNLTTIQNGVFNNVNATSIKLPSSLKTIGNNSLITNKTRSNLISNVNFGKLTSLTKIGENNFNNVNLGENLDLSKTLLDTIGINSFNNLINTKLVTLPNSLVNLNENTFNSSSNNITVKYISNSIPNAFYESMISENGFEIINMSNAVTKSATNFNFSNFPLITTITGNTFESNTVLESLNLPPNTIIFKGNIDNVNNDPFELTTKLNTLTYQNYEYNPLQPNVGYTGKK